MIGTILCALGRHKWSFPDVVQRPAFRLVGRRCVRDGCNERRVTFRDVWTDPVRTERVWTDEIREYARTNCGAS